MNNAIPNVPTISQSNMTEIMQLMMATGRPMFTWGSPGIGKSDIHRTFAEKVGGVICDVRLAQYDAVDIRGLPDVDNDLTVWRAPSTLPLVGNEGWPDDKPIILFLDEMLQAAPAVQSVAFQLVLERRVGEHHLRPNVSIFAASNRDTDRAGVQKMLLPLANRFAHFNLEPTLDGWKDWALEADVDPLIIAYLNFRPDMLNQFSQAVKAGTKAFPTPRTWHMASDLIEGAAGDVALRDTLIAATVGEAVGAEFSAFLRSAQKLPRWEDLMAKPDTTPLPEEPDMRYALASMMCNKVDEKTAEHCVTVAKRLPEEYQVLWMADTSRRKRELVVSCQALLDYQVEMHKSIHG